MNQKYYNNLECKIIAELPDNECVIEIVTGYTYELDSDVEIETVQQRLIVPRKSVTDKMITSNDVLTEAERIIKAAQYEANKILTEAKTSNNRASKEEYEVLQVKIKEAKKEIQELEKASPYIQTAKKFIAGDYKYAIRYTNILTIEECYDDIKKECQYEDAHDYSNLHLKISENCVSLRPGSNYRLFETLDEAKEYMIYLLQIEVQRKNYHISFVDEIDKWDIEFDGSAEFKSNILEKYNTDIQNRIASYEKELTQLKERLR